MAQQHETLELTDEERAVLAAATTLNTRIAAVTLGVLTAVGLFLATLVLILRGDDDAGAHLSLLSVFIWGYEVTWPGALIGATWGFIYGAVTGALLYRGYARTILHRLTYLDPALDRRRRFRTPILRIYGPGLGLVLGGVGALQLIATTNWLVFRGSSDEHSNAMLLGQYFPGYSVSFAGSLIGAAQLFTVIFLACLLLAWTYNRLVDWRQGRHR
ncbi:MAG: hypothetical protein R3E77_11130 [Steroidobacteraceae bacterium]